jgi:molybdopterin-biosynthesis enzyme MoeA-like protein
VRPAQIRVRNAEVVLLAGGNESAADDDTADSAADVAGKGAAAQTLDNSQMSWVYLPRHAGPRET